MHMISMQATTPDLLTVRQVARRLSISERTVWRWTALGLLPLPVHPHARSTRWRAADIERYLENLSIHSTTGDRRGETLLDSGPNTDRTRTGSAGEGFFAPSD